MKIIIAALTLVLSSLSVQTSEAHFGTKCHVNDRVYCQITLNSPKLNKEFATRLADSIHYAARKFEVNPEILTAIIGAESSYQLGAIGGNSCGFYKNYQGKYRKVCIGKDFGLTQISHRTIASYGFDVNLLLTDMEYSVNAGAEVLSWFKSSYGAREKKYYLRYNCGTKKSLKRRTCQNYDKALKKWMLK